MFWIKHDVHIIRKYLRFLFKSCFNSNCLCGVLKDAQRKNKAVYLILSKNLGCIKKIKVKSGFCVTMIKAKVFTRTWFYWKDFNFFHQYFYFGGAL